MTYTFIIIYGKEQCQLARYICAPYKKFIVFDLNKGVVYGVTVVRYILCRLETTCVCVRSYRAITLYPNIQYDTRCLYCFCYYGEY